MVKREFQGNNYSLLLAKTPRVEPERVGEYKVEVDNVYDKSHYKTIIEY